ncbi:vitamin K epoxide reductase family protein [Flavobacterium sp. UW10123]|uniref:vitamin K epoxide reductase family protein n=1 Tax=Flavobacterium sp. UW10123 TaxID=3230800 RepID=UPI003397645A
MTDFFYLKKYLQEHKYYHFEDKILSELESHPDYPSLAAIVDVLNFYDIENIAARIDQSDLINLPKTFLSVFCTHTGSEIVYTKKAGSNFEIQFANGYVQKLSRAEYLEGWNGIIVAIEENDNTDNTENNFGSSTHRLLLIAICCGALLNICLENSSNIILAMCYALTSFAGLFISVFLVREDLGFIDSSISKICHAAKNTSCKDVLFSNKAKIFGRFKLSDISWVYFLALTVFSIFTVFQDSLFVYSCLSLLSVPVLFYSIFIQYFTIKKWCVLCLGIIGVLIIQIALVLIYSFNDFLPSVDVKGLVVFFAILTLFAMVWMTIKKIIKSNLKNKNSEVKYNQLKRKYSVFKALLNADHAVDGNSLEGIKTIVIGEENTPITLYAILSASCMHCHNAYENLMKLQTKHLEQINIKLIFNINIDNHSNPYNTVYKQLLSYHLEGDYYKVTEALKDWHIERLTLEEWNLKWKNEPSEEAAVIIQKQYNWCLNNKVLHTPAIILNEQLLPKDYQVNELQFFIDNLIEEKTLVF